MGAGNQLQLQRGLWRDPSELGCAQAEGRTEVHVGRHASAATMVLREHLHALPETQWKPSLRGDRVGCEPEHPKVVRLYGGNVVKHRVILVGNGSFGSLYRERIIKHHQLELVGVVDTDYDKLRTLGGMTIGESYETLAQSVEHDAVVVCTPPSKHYDVSTSALGRGKHVLCMKPGALDKYQCAGITNLVSDEVTFNVDYTTLRAPEWEHFINTVTMYGVAQKMTLTRKVATGQKPEGCVIDLLPHDVAMMINSGFFVGSDILIRARGDESSVNVSVYEPDFHRDAIVQMTCGYDAIWPTKRVSVMVKPNRDVSNQRIDVEWDQIARCVTTKTIGDRLGVYFKHDHDPIMRRLDVWAFNMQFGISRTGLFGDVTRVLDAIHDSMKHDARAVGVSL